VKGKSVLEIELLKTDAFIKYEHLCELALEIFWENDWWNYSLELRGTR